MSISTNSINCGDDFTPAENGEVNGDAISLNNDGQFDGKNSETPIIDQQQLKEFRQKIAKMEMELKMAKLELENKEQKLKYQELMGEQKALKQRVAKIEQEKEKNADQLAKILEKISEMEKHQKQQHEEITTKVEQFSQLQNDQKILLEKISELEKEQKQRKALLNFRQNYWDANFCHEKLEIIGDKKLIVHYKQNDIDWCTIFAKHPILLNNNSFDIFYYEISFQNMKSYVIFGFAVKQQNKFYGIILSHKGTYAYFNTGLISINGEGKESNAQYSYGVADTVGIGVNSATRQIIFTKNGICLGCDSAEDFLVASSFADDSFYPFITLLCSDDKIEANFGPNFKFDLATL
ncbi:hypothetical protein niasHS_008589 [Heterodera schachtii]|uniref:B30.2/SPRY domain-containing protein n=1 Tax=Heterodera schachtii TaxID=97005 RepID=A0ABD2J8D3_HETSC